MHAILQLSFPELERLFSTRSALFLNIVQLYPHPYEVLTCSKTVIRNRLKANTKKNLSLVRAEEKGIETWGQGPRPNLDREPVPVSHLVQKENQYV